MASVELVGVAKRFGATQVLDRIDLAIVDGEFLVLVGPSGCGKSTLLRIIAGLEEASAGEVRIGGERVDQLPPARRGIAMVFQSYALYPHMTLRQNMGFGLRLTGAPRAEIDRAVDEAARTLGIDHLLERRPKELSGGQRQRVAIGRAIVRQPKVFLFDEPLSNLDASLRVRMRYEFARLHERLATTTVYVTHDQVEAMTLADRIVVLNRGRVEQVGTPDALYRTPATRFVAEFIGSPRMAMLDAVAEDGALRLRTGEIVVAATGSARSGEPVTLGVRPEHWRLGDSGVEAEVVFVELLGATAFAHLATPAADEAIVWQLAPDTEVRRGDRVRLTTDPRHVHLFDAEGRALPARNAPPAIAA